MGKPTKCLGENKGADQLRSNRETDQRLCFRYTDSIIPQLSLALYKISSFQLSSIFTSESLCSLNVKVGKMPQPAHISSLSVHILAYLFLKRTITFKPGCILYGCLIFFGAYLLKREIFLSNQGKSGQLNKSSIFGNKF